MTLIDKAEAHDDDDLIRRGDALAATQLGDTVTKMQARIRAIPRVDAEPVCTCCGGTGVTYQTERRCACQGPDLTDPATVHVNMLRGTIAKPTVEQIVHLYGANALSAALPARGVGVRPLDLDDEQTSRAAKFMAMALWSELHEKAGEGVLPETLPKAAADVLRKLMQEKLTALSTTEEGHDPKA